MAETIYDVIVVGAGNAGLTAALAARQQEMRVLLLDKCPKAARGGNTRFSGGGFRFTYSSLDDMRPMVPELTDEEASRMEVGTYIHRDFFEDVMQVTEYAADKKLTNILVDQFLRDGSLADGHERQMDSFDQHSRGQDGRKVKFPSGRVISVNDGGLGLVEMLFPTAENKGIEIVYEVKGDGFDRRCQGSSCRSPGANERRAERFQEPRRGAGRRWFRGQSRNARALSRHGLGFGESQRLSLQLRRGRSTLAWASALNPPAIGAAVMQCLVDAEAPDVECAYEHRYSYPYGIMVDINGKRFVDEGEDFFSYTYAKCGREVLRLPWRTAYQIFDSKTRPLLRSEYNRGSHVSADTIEALAKKLPGLDWENVVKTVNEFNDAVNDVPFDPSKQTANPRAA